MSSAISGVKKPAFCRYFVNSGTCFYGEDCQFLHANPTNSVTDANLTRETEHLGPVSDPANRLFLSYNQSNGLPSESKLSYINVLGPNPGANEFIPKATSLTHSASTPSFSTFSPVNNTTFNTISQGSSAQWKIWEWNAGQEVAGQSSVTADSFEEFLQKTWSRGPVSTSTSPLHSPGITPQHSPLSRPKNKSPIGGGLQNYDCGPTGIPAYQESVGGTTYFYTEDEQPPSENTGVILPSYQVYPSTPSHIVHMKPKANAPSFFMSDELRQEILQRHILLLSQVDREHQPNIPQDIDNYHNLFPLEALPTSPLEKSNTFGYITSVYKATNTKDGLIYCLRRIHGFRVVHTKCTLLVDMWKKLNHSNLVQLQEVFTTKAFGDHSLVFAYDYFPGAETLMAKHFNNHNQSNGFTSNNSPFDTSSRTFSQSKGAGVNGPRQHAGLLPESLIWCYIVQMSSALRTIHAAGLACRVLDPTKILLTGKSRLRLNCVGIFDVINFDPNQTNMIPHHQQEDLMALGKVVLALACNSLVGIQREHLQTSMELVARNYSADLRNLIFYLLSGQTRGVRSVNDIMPMIGARFYTQLDAAQMRSDIIENELAKEVENGRLFRLLCKLGIVNERLEFNMDPQWSETGDRYLLKLFRDYLFHQVTEDGRPWIDMAHIVQCLNKLDAGIPEKICLTSRDEPIVLVVSYADLKNCFETSFEELQAASQART